MSVCLAGLQSICPGKPKFGAADLSQFPRRCWCEILCAQVLQMLLPLQHALRHFFGSSTVTLLTRTITATTQRRRSRRRRRRLTLQRPLSPIPLPPTSTLPLLRVILQFYSSGLGFGEAFCYASQCRLLQHLSLERLGDGTGVRVQCRRMKTTTTAKSSTTTTVA